MSVFLSVAQWSCSALRRLRFYRVAPVDSFHPFNWRVSFSWHHVKLVLLTVLVLGSTGNNVLSSEFEGADHLLRRGLRFLLENGSVNQDILYFPDHKDAAGSIESRNACGYAAR